MGSRYLTKKKSTCLATDWSRDGIGFWLFQKHCGCAQDKPLSCCNDRWKITLVEAGLPIQQNRDMPLLKVKHWS